jgi:hypothetical protein
MCGSRSLEALALSHFSVLRPTVSKATVFKDRFNIGVVRAVGQLAIAENAGRGAWLRPRPHLVRAAES